MDFIWRAHGPSRIETNEQLGQGKARLINGLNASTSTGLFASMPQANLAGAMATGGFLADADLSTPLEQRAAIAAGSTL